MQPRRPACSWEAAACEIDPRRDLHSRSRLLSSLRWRGATGVASAARAAGGMPQQLMFASAVRAACEQAGRRCMTLYMQAGVALTCSCRQGSAYSSAHGRRDKEWSM